MTRRKWLDVAVVVIPFALGVRLAYGQETEDGAVASGALMRLLWMEPQGIASPPYPVGTTGVGTPDLTLPEIPPGGQPLWLGVFLSNWGPQGSLDDWQVTLDGATLPFGLSIYRPPCTTDQQCIDLLGSGSSGTCGSSRCFDDMCWPAFVDHSRFDISFFWKDGCCGCGWPPETDRAGCFCAAFSFCCISEQHPFPDLGEERYAATLMLFADQSLAGGTLTIELLLTNILTWMNLGDFNVKTPPATLTITHGNGNGNGNGSCCYDIGVSASTPCAPDVTPRQCDDLNTGPVQPVFREGEDCPDEDESSCPSQSSAIFRFVWMEPQGLASSPYPPGTMGVGTTDLKLGGLPEGRQPLWLGVFISNWGAQGSLFAWTAQLDGSTLPLGLSVFRPACAIDQECFDVLGPGLGSECGPHSLQVGECAPAFQQIDRPDFERFDACGCASASDSVACGCTILSEAPHVDPGSERNGATFVLLADDRLAGGPHTIKFLVTEMHGPDTRIRDVWEVPATIAIRIGSCCFDIGLTSTTPCVSDLTFAECDTLNTGPLPPVFRDGEPCSDDGDPCTMALGACCDSQAGPLADVGRCENLVLFLDCQCPTCTWFQDEACEDIIADGLCEADFVAIPTVSEWGLVVTTLLLLIGSKIIWRERATKLLLGDPHFLRREE